MLRAGFVSGLQPGMRIAGFVTRVPDEDLGSCRVWVSEGSCCGSVCLGMWAPGMDRICSGLAGPTRQLTLGLEPYYRQDPCED